MFTKDKDVELISKIVIDAKRFFELRLRHFHLDSVSRLTELFSVLAVTLVIILFLFMTLMVATIAVFLWLRSLLSGMAAFAIITGFYFLLILLIVAFRETLVTTPLSKVIGKIFLEKRSPSPPSSY